MFGISYDFPLLLNCVKMMRTSYSVFMGEKKSPMTNNFLNKKYSQGISVKIERI